MIFFLFSEIKKYWSLSREILFSKTLFFESLRKDFFIFTSFSSKKVNAIKIGGGANSVEVGSETGGLSPLSVVMSMSSHEPRHKLLPPFEFVVDFHRIITKSNFPIITISTVSVNTNLDPNFLILKTPWSNIYTPSYVEFLVDFSFLFVVLSAPILSNDPAFYAPIVL